MAALRFVSLLLLPLCICYQTIAQADESFADWQSVVDYGDPGYTESGQAWRTWPFGPAVDNSYRYLSHYEQNRPRVGSAFWAEIMPTYGVYEVLVSFRKTENRTDDADYKLLQCEQVCADENTNIDPLSQTSINQRSVGNDDFLTWTSLGEFTWQQGQQIIVHLDGTDDNQSDEADAVKWVLLEQLVEEATSPAYLQPIVNLLLE